MWLTTGAVCGGTMRGRCGFIAISDRMTIRETVFWGRLLDNAESFGCRTGILPVSSLVLQESWEGRNRMTSANSAERAVIHPAKIARGTERILDAYPIEAMTNMDGQNHAHDVRERFASIIRRDIAGHNTPAPSASNTQVKTGMDAGIGCRSLVMR